MKCVVTLQNNLQFIICQNWVLIFNQFLLIVPLTTSSTFAFQACVFQAFASLIFTPQEVSGMLVNIDVGWSKTSEVGDLIRPILLS